MPRILVTGAAGFIGRRIVDDLVAKKHSVVATARKEASPKDARLCEWRIGDLSNQNFVKDLVKKIDTIIHCAGLVGTLDNEKLYFDANVRCTLNLIEAAKSEGVQKFIHVSSPSILFDFKDQLNVKEDEIPSRFSSPYARTKHLAELAVLKAHSDTFQCLNLRPRFVLGAGDRNVLPRLLELYKKGLLVKLIGRNPLLSFTSIQNLLEIIELCITSNNPKIFGETYNVCNDDTQKFWDLFEELCKELKLPNKKILSIPAPLAMTAAKVLNQAYKRFAPLKEAPVNPISMGALNYSFTLDNSKLKKNFQYTPRATIRDGIQDFALARPKELG